VGTRGFSAAKTGMAETQVDAARESLPGRGTRLGTWQDGKMTLAGEE